MKSKASGIRAFIVQKDLLTLSDRDNMRIVPTPVFLRGIYSVARFIPRLRSNQHQEAEYWVTPIDPKTPREQAESKLREYNNWMLLYLTMHEALPGHYTQFEHANSCVRPHAACCECCSGTVRTRKVGANMQSGKWKTPDTPTMIRVSY